MTEQEWVWPEDPYTRDWKRQVNERAVKNRRIRVLEEEVERLKAQIKLSKGMVLNGIPQEYEKEDT